MEKIPHDHTDCRRIRKKHLVLDNAV